MISLLRKNGIVAERLKNLSMYLVSGREKKHTQCVLLVILPSCCQQFLRNMEIFGWNPRGERNSRKEVPVVSSCQEMISGKQWAPSLLSRSFERTLERSEWILGWTIEILWLEWRGALPAEARSQIEYNNIEHESFPPGKKPPSRCRAVVEAAPGSLASHLLQSETAGSHYALFSLSLL